MYITCYESRHASVGGLVAVKGLQSAAHDRLCRGGGVAWTRGYGGSEPWIDRHRCRYRYWYTMNYTQVDYNYDDTASSTQHRIQQ
jgi:hypothetical protein